MDPTALLDQQTPAQGTQMSNVAPQIHSDSIDKGTEDNNNNVSVTKSEALHEIPEISENEKGELLQAMIEKDIEMIPITQSKDISITSFSRSCSTSNQAQDFFQPNPKNFFDDWPVPYHYLPTSKQDKPKGFNLSKFITAAVTSNLKSLGVEELDCKEYVEKWLSQRQQRRWTQSLRRNNAVTSSKDQSTDSHPCIQALQTLVDYAHSASGAPASNKPDLLTIFNLSKPNSSMIRLSGEGNTELGHFLGKMEDIRSHLNNATCTTLQATILMMLPHMKLLSGHHLDSTSCQTFVKDWIQIIALMAMELKPESPNAAKTMISREFHLLRSDSRKLYKTLKKLYKKIQKLFSESDIVCKEALARLHPKSTASYKAAKDKDNSCNILDEKIGQSETIHFAPVPLHKTGLGVLDLFKNNVFFSQSKKGNLIIKNEIDGEWENFSELQYNHQIELFLSVVEDLRWTMKVPLAIVEHISGLCIKGYPENVRTKISENMEYLKKAGKQEDLLVLSKVTIVTQVNCLHDSMKRLLRTLKDALEISKYFYKSIKTTAIPAGGKKYLNFRMIKSANQASSQDNTGTNAESYLPLSFDNAKVKLLVPFPISTDPIEDQFFISSV